MADFIHAGRMAPMSPKSLELLESQKVLDQLVFIHVDVPFNAPSSQKRRCKPRSRKLARRPMAPYCSIQNTTYCWLVVRVDVAVQLPLCPPGAAWLSLMTPPRGQGAGGGDSIPSASSV